MTLNSSGGRFRSEGLFITDHSVLLFVSIFKPLTALFWVWSTLIRRILPFWLCFRCLVDLRDIFYLFMVSPLITFSHLCSWIHVTYVFVISIVDIDFLLILILPYLIILSVPNQTLILSVRAHFLGLVQIFASWFSSECQTSHNFHWVVSLALLF